MEVLDKIALGIIIASIIYLIYRIYVASQNQNVKPIYKQYGDLTLEGLSMYDGRDPWKPLLLAIEGKIYNVNEDHAEFGRNGTYEIYAGRECSRALAKSSLKEEDCNDNITDCTKDELNTLNKNIKLYNEKFPIVGRVVPKKKLTLKQLREYDGNDKSKPMYLAINGTIYDVTEGHNFYGPDGIYPFAGRECARAFALFSTDESDCVANLEGLDVSELDQLREWEAKFMDKYHRIGIIINE